MKEYCGADSSSFNVQAAQECATFFFENICSEEVMAALEEEGEEIDEGAARLGCHNYKWCLWVQSISDEVSDEDCEGFVSYIVSIIYGEEEVEEEESYAKVMSSSKRFSTSFNPFA